MSDESTAYIRGIREGFTDTRHMLAFTWLLVFAVCLLLPAAVLLRARRAA